MPRPTIPADTGLPWGRIWHGALGFGLLAGASAASLLGVEWVGIGYYGLAWWGYILTLDGIVQLRTGNSLIRDRAKAFGVLCLASAFFWFFWELVNLRIQNWHYVGVPIYTLIRWPGSFVAFATVLPATQLTYEIITLLGVHWGGSVRPFRPGFAWRPLFFALGVILMALPLIWPGIFFHLVWVALIFLLEPINYTLGAPSLVRHWEAGDLSPLVRLLLTGAVLGFLWESWNFLSQARWEYSLPYLASPKLFAMPLAGFLGFPPFAVECWVFMASLTLLRGGRGFGPADYARQTRPELPAGINWIIAAAAVVFGLWMCHMIDLYLIRGWVA